MLVNVDYSYSIREWGSDAFDVEDPKDLIDIEGYVRDDLEAIFGKEGIITDIVIEKVEEVKLNV